MEPFRIIVDRYVYEMRPYQFEKEEKHELWRILDQTVLINDSKQNLSNAMRIYTRSVFDAINDDDVSQIKFYSLL